MCRQCNDAVSVVMHVLPEGGVGHVRGTLRRNLIMQLAIDRQIELTDANGLPGCADIKDAGCVDDLFVAARHRDTILRAIDEENRRLTKQLEEQEARRKQEAEAAERAKALRLASLPRFSRAEAEAAGLHTRAGWHKRGFVVTSAAEDALGMVAGRYPVFAQPNLYRFKDLALAAGLDSKSGWKVRGRNIQPDTQPVAFLRERRRAYELYHEDQTQPRRKVALRQPEQIDIMAALWVINRYAKRCRDAAERSFLDGEHGRARIWARKKRESYHLKSQTLEHLVRERLLTLIGYHRFDKNWAEIWQGGPYTFHRPCEPPKDAADAIRLDGIEAKRRTAKEPRLKDAVYTLTEYLAARETCEVYCWPERESE